MEETRSVWYEKITKEISPYQYSLSKKDYKKYKLDLLLRIAGRIDGFSVMCGQCQLFQQNITQLTHELGNLIQLPDKERQKDYFKTINDTVKHLQTEHKLITEGQNFGIWMTIGAGTGTALGIALGSTSVGVALGTALGLAIGAYMDRKAKAEGKVI